MSVADAAASGNHLQFLYALRDRIAEAISDPDCPKRDLASLSRRLQDIVREITELEERERLEGGRNGSSGGSARGRKAFDASVI